MRLSCFDTWYFVFWWKVQEIKTKNTSSLRRILLQIIHLLASACERIKHFYLKIKKKWAWKKLQHGARQQANKQASKQSHFTTRQYSIILFFIPQSNKMDTNCLLTTIKFSLKYFFCHFWIPKTTIATKRFSSSLLILVFFYTQRIHENIICKEWQNHQHIYRMEIE